MASNKGKIYLFPMTLGDSSIDAVIPKEVQQQIKETKYFIVENIRTTRRYLKKIDREINIDALHFEVLNKHTNPNEIKAFLSPALEGNNIGIISEAGCPGIADPGSEVIALAHELNIEVIPQVGPSSILLALISSGFNGQQFAFNGYLPKESSNRKKKLKKIEQLALNGTTQIFMETPFRNNQLLEDVFSVCMSNTKLCIASDITLPTALIQTKRIKDWQNNIPNLKKRPTIFILG